MTYKYFLSLCLAIKNERKYMHEFITHYLRQGVDHFYIVNNNSDDNISEFFLNSSYSDKISLFNDDRNMQILLSNYGAVGHATLLNDNLHDLIKAETKWAIVVDADEFMYGKNGYTIKTFLHSLDEDIGRIYVMWNIMNPCLDTEFSLKNNIKRVHHDRMQDVEKEIQYANFFGKSIIKTATLTDEKLWLHKIQSSEKQINNYGNIDTNKYDNVNTVLYSEAIYHTLNITLNHYAIRNKEDLEKKQKQLTAVSDKKYFIKGLIDMLALDDSYLIEDREILHSGVSYHLNNFLAE